MMVSPYTDHSRDGNIVISLGPRFSGETERIGNIAMPITASRLHVVDYMMIGWLGASISRGEAGLVVSIWSCGSSVKDSFVSSFVVVFKTEI